MREEDCSVNMVPAPSPGFGGGSTEDALVERIGQEQISIGPDHL